MTARIVVVEDDPSVAELVTLYLRNADFIVAHARTAAEARVKFEEEKPALVILDLGLPDANGLELLREIRKHADTPLLAEKIPQDIVYTHQQLMTAMAFSIAKFCAVQPASADTDVLTALQALSETYKTLSSGIIYEKPPVAPLPRELYAAMIALLAEIKKQQAERAAPVNLKDTEIFYLLVFLYRMGLLRTNGRPRSRRFIEFLRGQFPAAPEFKREESRIIVP